MLADDSLDDVSDDSWSGIMALLDGIAQTSYTSSVNCFLYSKLFSW